MNVKSTGLTILFLRVLYLNNPHQRKKLNEFLNDFIEQCKFMDKDIAEKGLVEEEVEV